MASNPRPNYNGINPITGLPIYPSPPPMSGISRPHGGYTTSPGSPANYSRTRRQRYSTTGKPLAPELQSQINPETGMLDDQFNISGQLRTDLEGSRANALALDTLRQRALERGPSAWAQLATQNQRAEELDASERGDRQALGAAATARGALARSVGSTAGSRERLARQSQRDLMAGRQELSRQGIANRLQIGMQDQELKTDMLKSVPGFDLQYADQLMKEAQMNATARGFDVKNSLDTKQYEDEWMQNTFDKAGKIYAGEETAKAQTEAARIQEDDDSWLCTEAGKVKEYTDEDKKALLALTRFAFKKDRKQTRFYFNECHKLVDKMKHHRADWARNSIFIANVLKLVKRGQLEAAFQLYVRTTYNLINKFWPECRNEVYLAAKSAERKVACGQ